MNRRILPLLCAALLVLLCACGRPAPAAPSPAPTPSAAAPPAKPLSGFETVDFIGNYWKTFFDEYDLDGDGESDWIEFDFDLHGDEAAPSVFVTFETAEEELALLFLFPGDDSLFVYTAPSEDDLPCFVFTAPDGPKRHMAGTTVVRYDGAHLTVEEFSAFPTECADGVIAFDDGSTLTL